MASAIVATITGVLLDQVDPIYPHYCQIYCNQCAIRRSVRGGNSVIYVRKMCAARVII